MNKTEYLINLGFSEGFLRQNLSDYEKELNSVRLYRDKRLSQKVQKICFINKDNLKRVYSGNDIHIIEYDETMQKSFELKKQRFSQDFEDLYEEVECDFPVELESNRVVNEGNSSKSVMIYEETNISEDIEIPSNFLGKKRSFCSYDKTNINSNLAGVDLEKLEKLKRLSHNVNCDIKDSKLIVKAYTSKMKQKHMDSYIENSKETEKINEMKLYHKCNFPECSRTFSSSGWLKSHLDDHMKEIQLHDFNTEFEQAFGPFSSIC